jgi:hypothetical protein
MTEWRHLWAVATHRAPQAQFEARQRTRWIAAASWAGALVALAVAYWALGVVDPPAREVAVSPDTVPAAVIRAVNLRYPRGTISAARSIRSRTTLTYELDIVSGGETVDAMLDPTGRWNQLEFAMSPAQLPVEILRSLAASAQAGWPIRSAEVVRYPGRAVPELYEVNVERHGVVVELLYRADGQRVRAQLTRG